MSPTLREKISLKIFVIVQGAFNIFLSFLGSEGDRLEFTPLGLKITPGKCLGDYLVPSWQHTK